MVLSLAIMFGLKGLRIEASDEIIAQVVSLVMAWLVSQGLADAGAGGTTRATKPKTASEPLKAAKRVDRG